jgi:EmrB/QacA subfamily drug resistance transporter
MAGGPEAGAPPGRQATSNGSIVTSLDNGTRLDPRPSAGNSHPRFPSWAVLAIASAAQFMVVLDISIVNVALPSMRTDLGLTANGLQWVVNAYTLTFAGFMLFGGRAADLFGRKKIFLTGLGLFTLASLAGGFAQTEGMLITARALQGFGGAILAPATLSLLTTTYTEPRARARALGVWGATAGSGGAFGVLAGGLLTDLVSWRWVLFVNVPFGLLLLAAAGTVLLESRGQVRTIRGLDLPGTLTVTAGLALLVYGIVSTDTYAWTSGHTLATLAVAAGLLLAFVLIESGAAEPMVPLRIFRLRSLSAANGLALIVGAVMFSMFFFTTLYLQVVLDFSPLRAGVAFLPVTAMIITGAQVSSRLVSRVGPRPLLLTAAVANALALLWLSRIDAGGGYWTQVLGPAALLGAGMGTSMVPMTLIATAGVEPREQGLAAGLINTTRMIGGAIGLAALSTIATDRTNALLSRSVGEPSAAAVRTALTAGYSRALLVSAVAVAAAIAIVLTLPRGVGRHAPQPAAERAEQHELASEAIAAEA